MKPGSIIRLVQELKRRRVFRGIVVYGASTLILLEAAQNICNAFGMDAPPRWFVWLLAIGFLGSLWFSWIYDFTPGGIVKTDSTPDHPVIIPKKEISTYKTTTVISVLIIIGLLTYNIIDRAKQNRVDRIDKSIAVLPLADIDLNSSSASHFEFVGHEITACLLKVQDYKVVPWEDSRRYSRIGKSYTRIGKDLSVALLVDWKPHKTMVENHLSVDLISVDDERLLWSENFKIEENWAGSEICRCSRKISRKITRKLKTYLTLEEKASMNEEPASATASMFVSIGKAMTQDTWDNIQTGNKKAEGEKGRYSDSIGFEKAIKYFTEAIEEDPKFAEAYANRAKAKLWAIRINLYDRNALDECEIDIRKAFQLHPDLPEAHTAMGLYYYYGLEEYKLAQVSFRKAVELDPDDNECLFYLAKISSSMGNWKQARLLSDKLFISNPRNALFLTNLGIIYLYLHEFSRSIECQDRAIELMPGWFAPYGNKIAALKSSGNMAGARKVIDKAEKETGMDYYNLRAELDLCEGNFPSALENIERITPSELIDLERNMGDLFLLKARILQYNGDLRQAEEYYTSAMEYFNNQVMFNPEDYFASSKLGIAYAGLGNSQKAIYNGEKALDLVKLKQDAIYEPYILYSLLQIHAMLGNHGSARKLLDELLDKHSLFTPDYIKLYPDLKHLLSDP